MALSRCKVFNRDNLRCFLTAEHPGQKHSFGKRAPGPPPPPPRRDFGERYVDDGVREALEAAVAWINHAIPICEDRRIPSADSLADGRAIIELACKALRGND